MLRDWFREETLVLFSEHQCVAGESNLLLVEVDRTLLAGVEGVVSAVGSDDELHLLERLGAQVIEGAAIVDLPELRGSARLRAAGLPLFTLVDTKLRNDFEVAEKARAVALAKYQRAVQNAVTNRRDSQDIAVAKADLEVAEAELALAQDLFTRTQILAPRAGVIVYSSKSDWLGKPVTTGERVMDIVDPADLELRVDLGVSDATALKTGMRAKLFLDGDPLSAVGAEISRIGYRPTPNAERQMVYRVFADFTEGGSPRLGARGTARIDGDRVPLGFYLFRRPLAALRQKIGL